MKTCDKDCCWRHISEPNSCAFKENMEEWMLCPLMGENWEEFIDKVVDEIHLLENTFKRYKKYHGGKNNVRSNWY